MDRLIGSLFLTLFFSSTALAGANSSGGGNAVVCNNPDGTIQSAQLLDLYEGAAEYGYTYADSTTPYIAQAKAVLDKIGAARGNDIRNTFEAMAEYVASNMHLLPDGTGLVPIDDSYQVIIPKNCQVVQLANFLDDQEIVLVDGSIWSHLSETNKAALIAHETLYWWLRMTAGAKNSIQARQAVSYAFSGGIFETVDSGLPSTALNCYTQGNPDGTPSTIFWAYQDASGNVTFQFDYLENRPMLTKTTIEVSGMTQQTAQMGWFVTTSNLPDTTVAMTAGFEPADGGLDGMISEGAMPTQPRAKFRCSRSQ